MPISSSSPLSASAAAVAGAGVSADCSELDALLEEAEADADRLVSIQHTTRLLNEHYDHAMKRRVVEMMWRLVYADGEKSHYEEHLIRQVADLLYLSQSEFIQARHNAEPA